MRLWSNAQGRRPTSPISSAFSGRCFPLPHSCVIRFPRPNPHKTYLICFYTGMGIQPCDFAQMPRVEDPQVLSHLLLVVAIIPLPRPCATFDFPGQIVKSPQVLSHLLLVVAIFPLPHPRAIRFPRPNPHKSYLICF